ncbi:MAG: rhamnogalacturonan acetylesterase [Rhodocyclaceae bacterium]
MKHPSKSLLFVSLLAIAGCASQPEAPVAAPAKAGSAAVAANLAGSVAAGSNVQVFDASGTTRSAKATAQGAYTLNADGLNAPLLLVATKPQGKQYLAYVASVKAGANVVNVNALTDRIASDVAQEAKFKGPVGLAASAKAPVASAAVLQKSLGDLRKALAPALKEIGIAADSFDPVTAAPSAGLSELLAIVAYNRGYNSASGERGETSLYDPYYREITPFAPFSLKQAQADLKDINAPDTVRVFVAGDSTGSNYDPEILPRMGWGQIFDRQFKGGAKVRTVNLAQSGRSSRSFIEEGWFDMIAANIRKGDYLLVQFGHNDEKCGYEPPRPAPARDVIDIKGLCTYPGTPAAGMPADMSFQRTLEKYVALAQKVGATPVLITPVTRRSFKNGSISGTTHTWGQGKFPGDYSQTIRDTAAANKVTLVDLDKKSMDFFNKIGESGSLDYYLAVDTDKFPYYVGQTGARVKPDNTHFQERGAEAVGGLVAEGLREAKLPIASQLK